LSKNRPLFRTEELPGGLRLHLLRTRAFKTVSARLVFHADLDEATAARALVPRVLGRGTKAHPDLRSLQVEFDRRFGATLTGDVRKMGERHLIEFRGDWVADRIAGRPLLQEMFTLLGEVLHEPAPDRDGGLREDYVLQERKVQIDEAEAIFNDKGRYARYRLIQEMCRREAYARPAIGRAEEIRAVGPDDIRRVHRHLLDRAPADLFLVGDVTWRQALSGARRLGLDPARHPVRLRKTQRVSAGRVRTVRERQPVGQGKLVLGFRTPIRLGSALGPGLSLMNALFGATPTSKLFKVVRERESLCYFIHSGLEWTKGLLVVHAGIEPSRYAKARRLILRQLDELRRGRIRDEELGHARQMLLHALRSLVDSPRGLVDFALERAVNGRPADLEGLRAALEGASARDAMRAARTVELDTVYFLTDDGTARQAA
jgi:predicted Zn-dependent peptidase